MAWTGSNRRAHLPADWSQRRAAVFKRDDYQCTWQEYGERCLGAAEECDHIRRGDDHNLTNLRSLCKVHHARKSSAEGRQAAGGRGQFKSNKRAPEAHPGLRNPQNTKNNGKNHT